MIRRSPHTVFILVMIAAALLLVLAAAWLSAADPDPADSGQTAKTEAKAKGAGKPEPELTDEYGERIHRILDATTTATPRYLPILFTSHDKHIEKLGKNCKQCHHDIEKNEDTPNSCGDCHNDKSAKVDLIEASHKSCRGCHREVKAKDPNSPAPVECMGCHSEKK